MVGTCLCCKKYNFDAENISFKRMTAEEYINGVIRHIERTNKQTSSICEERNLQVSWLVNRAYCELCGAPHAVFSDKDAAAVLHTLFFFSGTLEPSEKDLHFIEEFKENLFHT